MLAALSIHNIVLIEQLSLSFAEGLTALTGETGAGKSILLDSLSLALGARGDGGLVRQGADKGEVTAAFDLAPNHPARQIAEDQGVNYRDELIILRRVQSADGRTRAFLNDKPVSAAILREIGAALVEIHGQHDDRALVEPAVHRSLLDAFGGHDGHLQEVSSAWRTLSAAERALAELRASLEAAQREADYLRSSVEELEALAPQEGEEEALSLRRVDMMKSEKVASDLAEAVDALNGQTSPIPLIANLARRLERKSAEAPELVGQPLEALGQSLDHLEDARLGLEEALRSTEFDPGELERTEERLFALRAASRKYNVSCDDLYDLAVKMAADLADLDAGEERLSALEAHLGEAKATYDRAARALTERRQASATELEDTVHAELPALKLDRARFLVTIESDPDQASSSGVDRIEFHVQTNPGSRPGPIAKVASGGELSRFLLALKVALADRGSAPALVFDEIDSGVGGAVSDAIGLRLSRLAERVQVMTVTHAPQIAARSDTHLLISKKPTGDAVRTDVVPIEGDLRREEIARMLAGATVTDEARAAAQRLIEQS